MSRMVLQNINNNMSNQQPLTYPDSIHETISPRPEPVDDPSIKKRDYNYIGNRDRKEYVEGGIEIYDHAK